MDARIEQLELKVDKFSDLFHEMIANQRLMQKELSLLSETLGKVNAMKLVQVECATNTSNRLGYLETECIRKAKEITTLRNDTSASFKLRDRYFIGLAISIFLVVVSPIITHVLGGN